MMPDRIVTRHEFSYDISALGWAAPFHQIFEKELNLVFNDRYGDRLYFYEAKIETEPWNSAPKCLHQLCLLTVRSIESQKDQFYDYHI